MDLPIVRPILTGMVTGGRGCNSGDSDWPGLGLATSVGDSGFMHRTLGQTQNAALTVVSPIAMATNKQECVGVRRAANPYDTAPALVGSADQFDSWSTNQGAPSQVTLVMIRGHLRDHGNMTAKIRVFQ